jgi:peptide/nickel transport system ATP-binding protein
MTDLVEVRGLTIVAGPGAGVPIVSGADFSVAEGEIVTLIGESGWARTIALSLLGYTREGCRIAGGTIRVGGIDVLALDEKRLAAIRGQSGVRGPECSGHLTCDTIMEQVVESGLIHRVGSRAELEAEGDRSVPFAGVAGSHADRPSHPHQVSAAAAASRAMA